MDAPWWLWREGHVGSNGRGHTLWDQLPPSVVDPDLSPSACVLDPTGSYYLTTTYGALEHIKNYDKITVTRQLSVEVQDSIHRWERRRTLNKARASRSSVQVMLGTIVTGATTVQVPPALYAWLLWPTSPTILRVSSRSPIEESKALPATLPSSACPRWA